MQIDSGIAALGGALIGAAAGVAGTWVQQRGLHQRELTRLAIELAEKDYRNKRAEIKASGTNGKMAPIGAFFHYYQNVLMAVDQKKCTPKWILENSTNHSKIENAFRVAQDQYEKRAKIDSEDNPGLKSTQ